MRVPTVVLALLVIAALAARSCKARPSPKPREPRTAGMFLCPTPADASGLWLGWTLAASDGISIDYSSEANSAKRESCFRVNSDHLKPTGVKAGELFISDGSSSGFATSEYYVLYMQSHKVETK